MINKQLFKQITEFKIIKQNKTIIGNRVQCKKKFQLTEETYKFMKKKFQIFNMCMIIGVNARKNFRGEGV